MKNQIWKITRSLCAVFLSAGIAFASPPFATRADEITTEESTTAETIAAETSTEITTVETTAETATEETTVATEETTTATEESTTATEVTTTETEESTTATEETTTETEESTIATEESTTATEETTTATEETTTAETTPPISIFDVQQTAYVYNVTVEFGYFSFYYDFGVWDVTSFAYRASDSSNNPGATTTLGEPGWYGFDGVNNRIYVENDSLRGTKDVLVTITFDADTDEGGEPFPVKNVEMSLYVSEHDVNPATESGETWSVPNLVYYDNNGDVQISQETVLLRKLEAEAGGEYLLHLPSGNDSRRERTVYISLSGEPRDGENEPFFATTMTKLGFITVGISLVDGG